MAARYRVVCVDSEGSLFEVRDGERVVARAGYAEAGVCAWALNAASHGDCELYCEYSYTPATEYWPG